MRDFILNIISSCIVAAILKWLGFIFTPSIDNNSATKPYSTKYFTAIKKQFYICFPMAIVIIFWRLNTKSGSILATIQMTIAIMLLILSLFAFMCAAELIEQFHNKKSN